MKHSPICKKGQQEGEHIEIISPKSTKRKGPEAALIRCDNIEDEIRIVAKQILNFHAERKFLIPKLLSCIERI